MIWLVVALAVCVLLPSAVQPQRQRASDVEWCYHDPSCNDTTWPTIAPQFCNGSRQSPININSSAATANSSLIAFTFHNFSRPSNLIKIENTGKTVKVTIGSNVGISKGGLENYTSLQFHLHWGNGTSIPGSEHTVDGKRYPMELHIVNIGNSFNGNTTAAIADSKGFAALGFFIEEMSGDSTGQPESWHILSSYLANITNSGDSVPVTANITLDDLLVGVDRSKYFRYLGSLTTPNCSEAVVWTLFKDTIKVSRDVIDLFSRSVRVGNSTSPYARNTFRFIQPALPVTTQASASASGSDSISVSKTCFTVGLMALSLVLGKV